VPLAVRAANQQIVNRLHGVVMDAGPAPGYLPRMTRTTRDILQLLAILALTSLAAWSALGLRMQGDLSRVLKGTSEAYTTFEAFQSTFGTVGNDAILSISRSSKAAKLSGRPRSAASIERIASHTPR